VPRTSRSSARVAPAASRCASSQAGALPSRRRADPPSRRGAPSGAPRPASSRSGRRAAATLRSPEHTTGTPGRRRGRGSRRRCWRGSAGAPGARPVSTRPAPDLLLSGQLGQHRVEVARAHPDEEPGAPEPSDVLQRVPAGLGDDPHPQAPALEEAGHEDRPERGVVDVRVPRDDEHVDRVPAARLELCPRGGQERAQVGGARAQTCAAMVERTRSMRSSSRRRP
jgi:hypothetical protein